MATNSTLEQHGCLNCGSFHNYHVNPVTGRAEDRTGGLGMLSLIAVLALFFVVPAAAIMLTATNRRGMETVIVIMVVGLVIIALCLAGLVRIYQTSRADRLVEGKGLRCSDCGLVWRLTD